MVLEHAKMAQSDELFPSRQWFSLPTVTVCLTYTECNAIHNNQDTPI